MRGIDRYNRNGNPLDEYTAEAMFYHQKFRVTPNKQTGWKRLVGQEVPITGVTDLLSINGTNNYGSVAVGLLDVNGSAASGAPINATQNARIQTQILNGPQTPKATQPALDMWIPLNCA